MWPFYSKRLRVFRRPEGFPYRRNQPIVLSCLIGKSELMSGFARRMALNPASSGSCPGERCVSAFLAIHGAQLFVSHAKKRIEGLLPHFRKYLAFEE